MGGDEARRRRRRREGRRRIVVLGREEKATVLVGQNREKKKRRRRDRGWRASSERRATTARWGMKAASFEATEGLDALADAEIANGKDVGKARAAALVVGRKKGNGVEADGRGEGDDENPTTEEVQEGGQRQISENGGKEMAMEKRLWLWILEKRRTEVGKGGGGEKKRPDERSEDDGLGKKQGNGGEEEEASDRAGGGCDEAADEDVGRTWTVDPAGGEAVGGELGKEVVEDREGPAVLAVEGEEGREGVGGDRRQHWLFPKVLNRERKKRRGGEEEKRKEKIGLSAFKLASKTKIFMEKSLYTAPSAASPTWAAPPLLIGPRGSYMADGMALL